MKTGINNTSTSVSSLSPLVVNKIKMRNVWKRYIRKRRFRRRPYAGRSRKAVRKASRKGASRRSKSRFTRMAVKTGVVEKQKLSLMFTEPLPGSDTTTVDGHYIFPFAFDDLQARWNVIAPGIPEQRLPVPASLHWADTNPFLSPYTPKRFGPKKELAYYPIIFPIPEIRLDNKGLAQGYPEIEGREIRLMGLKATMGVGWRSTDGDEEKELQWMRITLVKATWLHSSAADNVNVKIEDTEYQDFGRSICQTLPNPVHPLNRPLWKCPYDHTPSMIVKHPRATAYPSPGNEWQGPAPAAAGSITRTSQLKLIQIDSKVLFAKKQVTETFNKQLWTFLHKIDKKLPTRTVQLVAAAGNNYLQPVITEWYALVVQTNVPTVCENGKVTSGFFIENPKLTITWLP